MFYYNLFVQHIEDGVLAIVVLNVKLLNMDFWIEVHIKPGASLLSVYLEDPSK